MRPLLLDLYCCAGGAAVGYHRAGFEVVGVDIEPQPNYPFEFHLGDAIELGAEMLASGRFAGAHASPPCQLDSDTNRLHDNEYPDLIGPTREMLEEAGVPWVIENVMGAAPKLRDPVMLCGAMFPPLRVYRHRLFETSFPLPQPEHPQHVAPQVKMGRRPQPGEWVQVVGNFSGVAEAREAMDIDWMSRNEMSEAIPPAYSEYVGQHLMAELTTELREAA